jgi:flagellin-specific chaperone FliS
MLNFKDFKLNEIEAKTKIQEIKLEISKKFDAIKEAKSIKKDGDVNSEIESIDKQAAIYTDISNLMKTLSAEIKKAPNTESSNIY